MVAYLDATTGSMLIGAVAAGAAGVGVAMRSTLGRFRRGKKAAEPAEHADDSAAEDSTQTAEQPS
jgi:hypothetical protein